MKKCCDKCKIITVKKERPLTTSGGYPIVACTDTNCTCHKLQRGAKDFAERFGDDNYGEHDHIHCYDQKDPPCGLGNDHKRCCLCGATLPSETNFEEQKRVGKEVTKKVIEKGDELGIAAMEYFPKQEESLGGWEERIADWLDNDYHSGVKLTMNFEQMRFVGKLLAPRILSLFSHHKQELIVSVEGMKKTGENGEGLPFEISPEIYGNKRMEAYKNGFNEALTDAAVHIRKGT